MAQKTEALTIEQLEERIPRYQNQALIFLGLGIIGGIIHIFGDHIYSTPVDSAGSQLFGIDKFSETDEFNRGATFLFAFFTAMGVHLQLKVGEYHNKIANRHYLASTRP